VEIPTGTANHADREGGKDKLRESPEQRLREIWDREESGIMFAK
jgi:hypothetical protein